MKSITRTGNVTGSTNAAERLAFSHRLRRALEKAGVRPSPTVLANEFNLRYWGQSITPHTARSWLLGISIPMQDKLKVLADWLQVSPAELRFGDGLGTAALADVKVDLQDREMFRRYLTLPLESRKTVRDVVQALATAASVERRS